MKTYRVFINSVSNEYLKVAKKIFSSNPTVEVLSQTQFRFPSVRELEHYLLDLLETCDWIVHLVGFEFGLVAKGRPFRSHSQIAFDLSQRNIERQSWIVVATEKLPDEDADGQGYQLQQNFRNQLMEEISSVNTFENVTDLTKQLELILSKLTKSEASPLISVTPLIKPKTKRMAALKTWIEKLEYLEEEQAIASVPSVKFSLKKEIEKCEKNIARIREADQIDS